MAFCTRLLVPLGFLALLAGCGRQPAVSADGLPLRRVVIYRNGVAYFERAGHVEESEVRFRVKETEVGDFLATLAVSETGGSSVRSVAFPLKVEDKGNDNDKEPHKKTDDEKRGLKSVVLSLDGKAHDLEIGYVAEAPVWRPSYRLVVEKTFRFEGVSDPGDASIVLGVRCPICAAAGIIVSAYGADAEPQLLTLLTLIDRPGS